VSTELAAGAPATAWAVHLALVAIAIGLLVLAFGSWRLRRAARQLHAREQRLAALMDMAADTYWELDAELRLDYEGRPMVGPDAPRRPVEKRRHPWDAGFIFRSDAERDAHIATLKAHQPFENLRVSRRLRDGRMRHGSVSGRPQFAPDGRFEGYWGIERDISEEVEARLASTAGEARYRELFERAPSALLLHRNGVMIDANPAAAALFGFPDAAAMKGQGFTELFDGEAARGHLRARLAAVEALPIGEALPVADARMLSQDGRHLTVQASVARVSAAGGAANLSMVVDITARVAAEMARRQADHLMLTLFDKHPDGIALTVLDTGRYVRVNGKFCDMLGHAAADVIGRTSTDIGLWDDPGVRPRLIDELLRTGRLREASSVLRRRDGVLINVTWSASQIDIDGVPHLLSNLRDVTEEGRMRMEHAAIFQSAFVGIALTREGRFQLANPRFHSIFGWPPDTLVGVPSKQLCAEDSAAGEDTALIDAAAGHAQPAQFERQMRRADGSVFWCRLQAQVVDPADPARSGTVWIADDVSARHELDLNLAAARDAAEAANRAKSAFLANTSHEIRTPLNGLLGLARLAQQPDMAPELRRRYLAQLLESAEALAAIISDILDLSKIEAGRVTLESLPFSPAVLLRALHAGYQPLADAAGLALVLELDPALPPAVRGDPTRVRQIVGNFLSNALKFTGEGSVRLAAHRQREGTLRFSVTDTGPGIEAAVQQRLFTPFTQGDDSTTRRYGGTGLGLSICRELAGLMGGRVGVDSAPGRGSEFWAELPLAATPVPPPAPAPPSAERARLAGMRVLVVEDNAVNTMIVTAMLEQWGATAAEAGDGLQAIDRVDAAAAAGQPFHLVLMDVQMPVMSGHEAARALRERYDADRLPIIALTASALLVEREAARNAGMNEFLTKPIDAAQLFNAVQRHAPVTA